MASSSMKEEELGDSSGEIYERVSIGNSSCNSSENVSSDPGSAKFFDNSQASTNIKDVNINHANNVHFGPKYFYNCNLGNGNMTVQDTSEDSSLDSPISIQTSHKNHKNTYRILLLYLVIFLIFTLLMSIMYCIAVRRLTVAPILNSTMSKETKDLDVLPIVRYSDWSNRSSATTINDLSSPVEHIIISPAFTKDCFAKDTCTDQLRALQQFHMYTTADIHYNFLVGGDGSIYEGRGWNKQPEVSEASWNDNSIFIGLLGTFSDHAPPEAQLNGTKKLIEEGLQFKSIDSAFDVYNLCQLSDDDCLYGSYLIRSIMQWSHWSDKVTSEYFNMIYSSNSTVEDENGR